MLAEHRQILFLDIDGVLNPHGAEDAKLYAVFDDAAMARLKTITDQSGCRIVLSTHWRKHLSYINHVFANYGLLGHVDPRTGPERQIESDMRTPSFADPRRRDMEILRWLQLHQSELGVEKWVVLDDMDLLMYPETRGKLESNFVRTDPRVGLTDADVVAVLAMFDSALPEAGLGGPGAGPPLALGEAIVVGDAGQLVLKVHGAELFRGFSSLGALDKMSPYAVVAFDKIETCRTAAAKGAHKTPTWNFEFASPDSLPQEISIAVWDKNTFHRDVLCGVFTLPIAPDMLDFEQRECTLQKKAKKTGEWVDTGKLILSVTVPNKNVAEIETRDRALTEKSLGGELDSIISFAISKGGERNRGRKITLSQVDVPVDDSGRSADDDGDEVEGPPVCTFYSLQTAAPSAAEEPMAAPSAAEEPMGSRVSKVMPSLVGSWKCVATQGLEEFLLASGVGMFQRKIAKAAAWPKWEFIPQDEAILFINHSAIGDLKETIPFGSEYVNKDGHGNPLTCNATWTKTDEGGTLLITRTGVLSGKKTDLTEARIVAGNKLEFSLTSNGIVWGRSFVRE